MKRLLMVVVVVASMCFLTAGAQAALILNGGFEEGSYSGGAFMTLGAGSTAITGWTVTGIPGISSIDWIGSYWQNNGGSHSLDLNGSSPGGIQQTFVTTPNQIYKVDFFLAGNPAGGYPVKAIIYFPNNGVETYFTFDTSNHSLTNMGWEQKSFYFVAGGTQTTLGFASYYTDGYYGPALDDVSVNPVPEPGTMMLLGSGLIGLAGWGRKKFRK